MGSGVASLSASADQGMALKEALFPIRPFTARLALLELYLSDARSLIKGQPCFEYVNPSQDGDRAAFFAMCSSAEIWLSWVSGVIH